MKYEIHQDGKWLPYKKSGEKVMCCDCGLVHAYKMRSGKKGGTIEIRATRDRRATAQARRWMRQR